MALILDADDLIGLTTNVRAYDERRVKTTLTVKTDSSSIFLAFASARISFADFLTRDTLGVRLDLSVRIDQQLYYTYLRH